MPSMPTSQLLPAPRPRPAPRRRPAAPRALGRHPSRAGGLLPALAVALATTLATLLALAALPGSAAAQYFGQNRVRYDRFDARVLRTAHFDVHHDARADATARDAARMAERWYARVSEAFGGHEFADRKPIVFYTDHPDFQQTLIGGGGGISEGTRGFAEGVRDRLVMPFAAVPAETDHVLGHEVVHLFQFDVAERSGGGIGRMLSLPLWFVEGQAEYLALGREDPNTAMWLRAALVRGRLPSIAQLSTDPSLFPYRYGHAFWAYVGGRWGDEAVDALFRAALSLGVEGAITRVLEVSPEELAQGWHASIADAYAAGLAGRELPGALGRRVFPDGGARALFVSPSVSPDGRLLAAFAARGVLGLDLVLADAATGRILRSLAAPKTDGHTDAISFLYATGAWSPDGRRFAHVVIRRGDHELAITDVRGGRLWRRVRVRDVQSISAVAWSPDGQRLAIAGTRDGQPDLFLYDLAERTVQQLTDDAFAELHPAWSPDGRLLAVATDQGGGTDLGTLHFGRPRLALVDPVGGRLRPLPIPAGFDGARMSNPQWSPDGRGLYFVSDAGGVADVFRLEVATGRVGRVTQVATGVSGLTERSPALSVAAATGELYFTTFDGSAYHVHALDAGALGELARQNGAPTSATEDAVADGALGVLPPLAAAGQGLVARYLADPLTGLIGPTADAPTVATYQPRLGLEGIGTPGIGLATGPLGAGVGGGASVTYGDLLGTRRAALAVQAQGRIQDIGGQALYLNQATRWNWFLTAGRTPVLALVGGVAGTIEVDGRPATLVQEGVLRTALDQLGAGAQYPLSRTRRLELQATGTRVTQSLDVRELAIDGARVLGSRQRRGVGGDAFAYGQVSAAFVHDDAAFGPVGPIAGTRWRLEVGQTVGGLAHETVLADVRRYVLLGRTTLAVRGFHFGRYGRDAEHRMLPPLFVGDGQFVRGYQAQSWSDAECSVDPARPGGCPEFDRLLGSRIATTSVELRLPLAGVRGWSLFGGALPPIELAPFVDAGVAWTGREGVRLDGAALLRRPDAAGLAALGRTPVVSAGVAARVHLGPMIVETFWASPFQRERGGHFGVNLAPAW